MSKDQLGNKILKMIHSIPLKIKINQHQITSIFGLQSIYIKQLFLKFLSSSSSSSFSSLSLSLSLSLITMQQPLNSLTIQQETEIDKGQTLTKMEFKFRKLQIWKLKQGFKSGKSEQKFKSGKSKQRFESEKLK
jgi:hypothetical protein